MQHQSFEKLSSIWFVRDLLILMLMKINYLSILRKNHSLNRRNGLINSTFLNFQNKVSELSRRWNTILPSLLATYEKLQKLGFTYCDGKVTVIIPDLNGKKGGS